MQWISCKCAGTTFTQYRCSQERIWLWQLLTMSFYTSNWYFTSFCSSSFTCSPSHKHSIVEVGRQVLILTKPDVRHKSEATCTSRRKRAPIYLFPKAPATHCLVATIRVSWREVAEELPLPSRDRYSWVFAFPFYLPPLKIAASRIKSPLPFPFS